MFKALLGGRELEKEVFKTIGTYLSILIKSTECLHNLLITEDLKRGQCIEELEREADSIRRKVLSKIYEGAFLPYLRPNMFLLIDTVEKAFDLIKGCAFEFCYVIDFKIYTPEVKERCIEINLLNTEMSELLLKAFNELQNKNNLKEKILGIRTLEKKIDELKLEIISLLRSKKISNFWEGETISNFVNYLSSISDIIEDASDQLIILDLSLP
jgi:predicted phosphate transport protein (TIGR00153 family)